MDAVPLLEVEDQALGRSNPPHCSLLNAFHLVGFSKSQELGVGVQILETGPQTTTWGPNITIICTSLGVKMRYLLKGHKGVSVNTFQTQRVLAAENRKEFKTIGCHFGYHKV